MQTGRYIGVGQLESIRDKILNSYLDTIEESFQNNHSQFKLINYGTGSGKTHQLFEAMCQTIKKYPDIQTIGIYVAPLREHLSFPSQVKKKYPDIPVYTINSLKMKMTDKYIQLYKKWIPSILKNATIWRKALKVYSREKVEEHKQKLKIAKGVISRLEYIKNVGLGDEKYNKSENDRAEQELNNALESFLEFFIKCELDKENLANECSELIKIFFPLYLLRKKSGILLLTYKKFETGIQYFIHNGKKWVKKSEHLNKYVVQNTNNSRKFILAFDEQEDGYQIMLKKKIDIISPEEMAINNALSSICREFALLFSKKNNPNRELLTFLDYKKGAFNDFQEHLERGKILDPKLQKYLGTYQKMTIQEGNSIKFLQDLISINKGIKESLADIVAIFNNYHEETPVDFNFEMLSRVLAKFENTRSLLIPQQLYDKIGNDLMNIFCYNNLYIYNIKALQNLYLKKVSGGHVRITERRVSDRTSVAELIYVILAMRSQIGKTKKILANVLDADDSQSHALDIWSKQISKVQKADEENATQSDKHKHQYLDRQYVYESNKPIINIKEISRYDTLIDSALREVSIGSTAILNSPEYKMKSMLVNNANIVFSISATGGIYADLTTSYDMSYLEDKLRRESGQSSFQATTPSEIALCEEIRNYRQQHRHTTVGFFSKDLGSFPNVKTKEVLERFESQILKDFIRSLKEEQKGNYPNDYKKQELFKFVRFLFYLFEDDDIKETIAFTQSLRWIKKLIEYCLAVNSSNFIFEESSEHPNIYYVQIRHNKYQSDIRIKLILYKASFNKEYDKNSGNQTYLDELIEKEGEKIFFISAYQSASKGLNPIVKTQEGIEKDFDSLVLLMDSYYTVIKSPYKQNSSWKRLFGDNKERIFNLVFKFYLLSLVLPSEIIEGFEELFFLHSKNLTRSKDALLVWGQNLLVRYNHHNVLTLTLTRKSRRFLPQDRNDYNTVDGEDLGELLVYKNKNYYFSRDRDARRSNSIHFMDFRKDKEGEKYNKFKKTQLYHYQKLMNKLEDFLQKCKIEFESLDFQADHYLENPFIKNIEALDSLEIINNTGIDLTEIEQQFLHKFFKHKGVLVLTFYNSGNTISTYEKIEHEEEDSCWRITEVITWSSIELDKLKNYLIFNKLLEPEIGSMAYRRDDGLWCPSTKLDGKSRIDFYSQLKKRYNYLDTGEFYSIQGINIPEFQIAAKKSRQNEQETSFTVLSYPSSIDIDILRQDCLTFSDGQYFEVEGYLACYLSQQDDREAWDAFCDQHKLKIAPELEKILIELGIKNWIKQSLSKTDYFLPINSQSFSEKEFWTIYVRSPRNSEAQAVAVKFLYKESRIYLKNVMRDINEIKRKFRFLRRQRNNSEKLINDQQYFVDESEKLYISCYTSDNFTPTLIGRHNIVEELENNTLEVNRSRDGKNSSKLLPVISYFNSELKPLYTIQNLICFDLQNELFIQYFVPPAKNLESKIKKGFRVYHLIAKKYLEKSISTSELIEHPMAALHFSTLTQNILKISDNSQSSLLQKIAKVLIEN